MQYRSFSQGDEVSSLGIGCGRVGSITNGVPMAEIAATLEAATRAGVTLFDTADIYGQGDSERTLARLLRRYPGRIFVVTKIGNIHNRFAGPLRVAKPLMRLLLKARPRATGAVVQARARSMQQDFSLPYLRHAADRSRQRLGVERLDGLLLHNPSEEILRRADIADCLAALVRDRTARHVGASVASLDEVKAALAIPAVTMLQVPIAVAGMIAQSDCLAEIKHRRVAVFVREVLRTPAGPALAKGEVGPALRSAIAPDFVTAVIIGVSTRHHLAGLVAALP